jgi:hypothetical protein
MYDLYIKEHVREMIFQKGVSLEHALSFLDNTINSMVRDSSGTKYFTKEELKNAKSIRPNDRTESNNFVGFGKPIPESTDRELPISDTDRSESSSERDN